MHGPLLVLSALQSFTVNHISQLYSFWNNGFRKGSANVKKALMIGLGHLLAFSGTMGFVGATTAEQLFEEFTGISLSTALRKKLVEAARSEERRVGKECRSRWAPTQCKQTRL